MSKKLILNDIKTKLLADTGTKHVDLWNNQIENITNETAFHFPACFVEFVDLEYYNEQSGIQEIRGSVTIHIAQKVIKQKGSKMDAALDFIDSIAAALNGYQTDTIKVPLIRKSEEQDSNHDMLIVWMQTYELKARDLTSSKYNDAAQIPEDTLSLDLDAVPEGIDLIISNDVIRTAKDVNDDQ